MRILRWAFRGLAVVVLLGLAAGIWKRDEIARLLAVNSLFDADNIVHNFSHMDELFELCPKVGDGAIRRL
jgi:hypothetical protein